MIEMQFNPFELRRLVRHLNATGKAVGITVQYLCRDQMRLWLIDLMRVTAPWAGAGKKGTYVQQQKTGIGAVAKDLDRLFARIDDPKHPIVSWMRQGERWAKRKDEKKNFRIEGNMWLPRMKPLHLSVRNRRGRVPRQKRQAWVTTNEYTQYVKDVQARVGSLKAGWLASLDHYARITGGGYGKYGVPAWIRTQIPAGMYTDAMNETGKGFVGAANLAHHASAIRRDTLAFTQRTRDRDMNKWMHKRADRIAEQFNAGREPKAIRVPAPERLAA